MPKSPVTIVLSVLVCHTTAIGTDKCTDSRPKTMSGSHELCACCREAPLKGFCQFTILRSNFLWVLKKTVLRAQISVSNNFGCFEKLWRSSFVLCRWKIHIMIFRWPTWIFVSNLIHFVQKHTFYSRGSESDFQRLRVLSFDPRANFASPLMFGFFSNFS